MKTPHLAAWAFAAVTSFYVLVGCRSMGPTPSQVEGDAAPAGPVQQRIVVIVHGDGSYLYHDRDGEGHRADKETLQEAFIAARTMPTAEIFIFHQRPENKLLGLLPRDDGTFYHFRGGALVHQTTYDQDRSVPLAAEAQLLQSSSVPADSNVLTAALYYGHAIPEASRAGYHRSRPTATFGVGDLARGLDRLAGPTASAFDAVVLSTCDGGTPHTIAALASRAKHILASPRDLHLSFIDADLLAATDSTTDPGQWTRTLAERAFDRLTSRTVTAVTLATYDVDESAPAARRMARKTRPDTSAAPAGARHGDCREVLGTGLDTTGVHTWDRPARFGPQADRPPHSGWGCPQQTSGPG